MLFLCPSTTLSPYDVGGVFLLVVNVSMWNMNTFTCEKMLSHLAVCFAPPCGVYRASSTFSVVFTAHKKLAPSWNWEALFLFSFSFKKICCVFFFFMFVWLNVERVCRAAVVLVVFDVLLHVRCIRVFFIFLFSHLLYGVFCSINLLICRKCNLNNQFYW